jgi:hypothetical protein
MDYLLYMGTTVSNTATKKVTAMNTTITNNAAAIVPSLAGDNTGLAAFTKAMHNVASNEGARTGLELAVIVAVHNMGSFINVDRLMTGTKSSTGKTVSANALQVQFLKDNDPSYVTWHNGKSTVKPTTDDSAKLSAWSEAKLENTAKCNAMEKMLKRVLPVCHYLRALDASEVRTENKGKTLVYTAKNIDPSTLAPVETTGTRHSILAEVHRVADKFNEAEARGFKAPAATVVTAPAQPAAGTGQPQETRTAIDTAGALHDIFNSNATTKATLDSLKTSPTLDLVIVDALKAKFTTKDDTGTYLNLVAFGIWLNTTMKAALGDLQVRGKVTAPAPETKVIKADAVQMDGKLPGDTKPDTAKPAKKGKAA